MIAVHLIATFLAACVLTWITNWLALIPWRRAKGSHWTERARLLYPARIAAAANLWVIPGNLVLVQKILFPDDLPPWLLLALAGWLGAVAGSRGIDREVLPQLRFRAWLREAAVGSILRLSGWFLLLGAVAWMPGEFGWLTACVTGVYVAAHTLLVWRCVSLLKLLRLVQPATPRVLELVAKVSARMDVPVRSVWILRGTGANAFAVPFSRDLLFNERLIELLTNDELGAICAHELGHLTESKISLVVRIAGSLYLLPWVFLNPLVHAFGILGVVIPALGMLLLIAFFKAVSRRLETRADAIAHGQESDPGTYARALEKIHEANQIPAIFPARQQTHPHLYDRLLAAGVTPAYPRPAPTESMAWTGRVLSSLVGILLVLYVIQTKNI